MAPARRDVDLEVTGMYGQRVERMDMISLSETETETAACKPSKKRLRIVLSLREQASWVDREWD